MFTPQQIQEQTFAKAVFGGYDMQQVDAFLEPLTEDYIALYKENEALRAKLTMVVNKLEEMREQEAAVQQELASARAAGEKMIAEAQKTCEQMYANAKAAQNDELIAEEDERLACAKQTALNFIDIIEQDIKAHLALLETLKTRDLRLEAEEEKKPVREKPFDWSKQEPSLAQSEAAIAEEISENLGKLVGTVEEEPEPVVAAPVSHPESATIKFTDLQFGKNYNPTGD